jgi:hypothetical protein
MKTVLFAFLASFATMVLMAVLGNVADFRDLPAYDFTAGFLTGGVYLGILSRKAVKQ